MIKAVIFDMDGTLLNSETLSSTSTDYGFRTILGRGLTPEENSRLVGRPVRKVLSEWFPDLGGRIYDTGRRYFRSRIDTVQPYAGIKEIVAYLRNRFRLAVVTSSRREDTEYILNSTGLKPYFDFWIVQEDTTYQKPDPEPVIMALRKLDIAPNEGIFVGDQPFDIIAAHEAGMIAVGAVWGSGDPESLYMYHPNFILKSPEELKELLQRI